MVKAWFTNTTSPAPANPDASPSSATGSPRTKKGTTAGGIVGGVAALALIMLFVLYLLRRRRRRATAVRPSDPGNDYQKAELEDNKKGPPPSELPVELMRWKVAMSELPSQRQRYELPVEMPELSEGGLHQLA